MGMTTPNAGFLDQLMQYEDGMARLYALFADYYEDSAPFWLALSDEEREHFAMMETMRMHAADGKLSFSLTRLSAPAVYEALLYFKACYALAARGRMPLRQAYTMALDLEDSLIERRIFEVAEGDSPELAQTLQMLADTYRRHAQRLRDAREELLGA